MKQSRWKSLTLWLSILSQVIAILLFTQVLTPYEAQMYNTLAAMGLQLLVTIGILNSPTDKDKF